MRRIKFIILILSMIFAFTSCGSDEPEGGSSGGNKSDIEFSLSPSEVSLTCEKNATATFDIKFTKGDGEWRITEFPSFLTASKSNGTGSATVTVTAKEENYTLTPREGVIKVEVIGAKVRIQSIRVVQLGLEGCFSRPISILLMSDGLAFDWEYGNDTKYFYWEVFAQSDYDKMSESEVTSKVTANADKRIATGKDMVACASGLSPDIHYVVVTVSFDKNNKQGETKVTQMQTTSSNQPEAAINNVSYYRDDGTNNYFYGWNATMNASCKRYFTYAAASPEMFHVYRLLEDGRTPLVAWYLRNEIKKDGSTHSTSLNLGIEDMPFTNGRDQLFAAQTKDGMSFFTAYPETDKYLVVITWAEENGEFSGIINAKYFDLTED